MIDVINNKKQLILVIVKLDRIIGDIKTKSGIGNVYSFNDRNKLLMIFNDLDNYIKNRFKKDIGSIKTI